MFVLKKAGYFVQNLSLLSSVFFLNKAGCFVQNLPPQSVIVQKKASIRCTQSCHVVVQSGTTGDTASRLNTELISIRPIVHYCLVGNPVSEQIATQLVNKTLRGL